MGRARRAAPRDRGARRPGAVREGGARGAGQEAGGGGASDAAEPKLLAWANDLLGLRVDFQTTVEGAAYHGYLGLLQWMCAEGRLEEELQRPDLCRYAALGGQVHVLEWLRERRALDERLLPCSFERPPRHSQVGA